MDIEINEIKNTTKVDDKKLRDEYYDKLPIHEGLSNLIFYRIADEL